VLADEMGLGKTLQVGFLGIKAMLHTHTFHHTRTNMYGVF